MNLNELTSTPSDRSSYPLDFSVQTESNQGDLSPVLYIENIDNAHDLHWSVVNAGSDEKYIQKMDGEPGMDNYHFQLKFRPGTLDDHFTGNPTPGFSVSDSEGVTWKMNTFKDTSSNIVYVSLLASDITGNEGKLILKPKQPLKIIIDKVTANPVGGARNTNVELRYNHILNSSDPNNVLSGNRMQHLGIVNHNGLRHIPLLPETMGSNTILNNGTPTDINIQITNYSKNDITLSHEENEKSKIEIVLRASTGDESGELFLTKKDNLDSISLCWGEIKVKEGKPECQENPDWNSPTIGKTETTKSWTISNKSQEKIESGKSLNFSLTNVVTSLPAGTAKIQINYYNIPGYWDGTLHLDIVKSPVVIKNKRVGINTPAVDNAFLNVPYPQQVYRGTVSGIVLGDASKISSPEQPSDSYGGLVIIQDPDSPNFPLVIFNSKNNNEDFRATFIVTKDGSAVIEKNVTAESFYDYKGPIMPKGAIILWSGSVDNIPGGWTLCDGGNNTPDLRNRFITGAGGQYIPGNSGGNDSITLNIEQMPSHNHNYHDPGHTHQIKHFRASSTDADDNSLWVYARDNNDEITTDLAYTSITFNAQGENKPFDNRPSYYALCYIMKL